MLDLFQQQVDGLLRDFLLSYRDSTHRFFELHSSDKSMFQHLPWAASSLFGSVIVIAEMLCLLASKVTFL